MLNRLVAIAAACLLACAPALAQDVRTLPLAAPLTGAEKMASVQGTGCASKTTPCAAVAVTPSLIGTYLAPTFQPRDADLDAIAAITTTSTGRDLLTAVDATAIRAKAGLGSAAVANVGTSGATVPLLSTVNAWGSTQSIAGAVALTGSQSFPGATTTTGYAYRSSNLGLVIYGAGATADVYIGNRSGGLALQVEPGAAAVRFGDAIIANADNAQAIGSATARWANVYARQMRPGAGAVVWTSGAGTPAGVVSAPVGSLYTRTDGGAGSTLYVKESGTDATGWVAK